MNISKVFYELSSKIKHDKKMVLLLILGFSVIFMICFSELSEKDNEIHTDDASSDYSSAQYCQYLEKKVAEIVQSIDGAGETKVMITLAETTEYIYATNDREIRKNSQSSDDSTFENDYVIIDSNNNDSGLLIKTIEPKVRGVAVVCEGGGNSSVQQQIYSAVSAVLNVSTSRISISKLCITEDE